MRHRIAGRKLGRASDHRRALFRNQVTDLLRYEAITTTEAKAKETRALAERMITLAKDGSLHSRRQALAFIYDDKVVHKLFDELTNRYRERPGGYTRLLHLGQRQGDGASMVRLELV